VPKVQFSMNQAPPTAVQTQSEQGKPRIPFPDARRNAALKSYSHLCTKPTGTVYFHNTAGPDQVTSPGPVHPPRSPHNDTAIVSAGLFILVALQVHVRAIRDGYPNEHDGIEPDTAHGAVAALFGAAGPGSDLVCGGGFGLRVVGSALQVADEKAIEDLAGLVAVADVFEGLGSVLAAHVEEDFFAAAGCWRCQSVCGGRFAVVELGTKRMTGSSLSM
jgi:hypothetical protein